MEGEFPVVEDHGAFPQQAAHHGIACGAQVQRGGSGFRTHGDRRSVKPGISGQGEGSFLDGQQAGAGNSDVRVQLVAVADGQHGIRVQPQDAGAGDGGVFRQDIGRSAHLQGGVIQC